MTPFVIKEQWFLLWCLGSSRHLKEWTQKPREGVLAAGIRNLILSVSTSGSWPLGDSQNFFPFAVTMPSMKSRNGLRDRLLFVMGSNSRHQECLWLSVRVCVQFCLRLKSALTRDTGCFCYPPESFLFPISSLNIHEAKYDSPLFSSKIRRIDRYSTAAHYWGQDTKRQWG